MPAPHSAPPVNDGLEICCTFIVLGIDPDAWPEMNWSDHTGAMSIWPDHRSCGVLVFPLG